MRGVTLDAGALIGVEKGDRFVSVLVRTAIAGGDTLAIPAGVLAQVWREGARQARLAKLLRSSSVEVVPLDDLEARAVGQLCGVSGATDVVDASVMLCARQRHHRVVTSDPDDLRRIDPEIELIAI